MIIRQFLIRHGGQYFGFSNIFISSVKAGSRIAIIPSELRTRPFSSSVDESEFQARNFAEVTQVNELVQKVHSRTSSANKAHQNDGNLSIRENFEARNRHRHTIGHLGSTLSPFYKPISLITDPPRPSDITLELLLASQSHLGHSTSLWNPTNSRYIFGIRQGIHIISLDVTAAHLRRACRIVTSVAECGGIILFIGTRSQQANCVVRAAELAGGYYLFTRWTPGSLTNGAQILGKCLRKYVDEFDREITGFQNELEDAPAIKPDLVICLNPLENRVPLRECAQYSIPTIGIIDTDADPACVTYPIPANDDSLRCVQLIAGVLGRAGEEGQQLRKEHAQRGTITYTPIKLGRKETS